MNNLNVVDFPVVERKLQTLEGLSVPNKAIVRTDTNDVLGVMGEDYKIVHHKEVIEKVEKDIPTELTERKITLCKNGAVMFAKYLTPRIRAIEVRKGDIVKFGIEVFNSYDGTFPVGFMFVAMRVICTNGMTIPKSVARISVKHTANVRLDNVGNEFNKRIPLYMKTADRWREWSETTPKPERVDSFLKKTLGDRLKKFFEEEYQVASDKTLWGLYNIFTYYNTHNIKTKKNNEQNKRIAQFGFEKRLLNEFYNFNWS